MPLTSLRQKCLISCLSHHSYQALFFSSPLATQKELFLLVLDPWQRLSTLSFFSGKKQMKKYIQYLNLHSLIHFIHSIMKKLLNIIMNSTDQHQYEVLLSIMSFNIDTNTRRQISIFSLLQIDSETPMVQRQKKELIFVPKLLDSKICFLNLYVILNNTDQKILKIYNTFFLKQKRNTRKSNIQRI